jgi:hypothetical protein
VRHLVALRGQIVGGDERIGGAVAPSNVIDQVAP